MADRSPVQRRDKVFDVGDVVEFLWGVTRRQGTIIEDRGPLGMGGMRIYRLSVRVDSYNTFEFEVPADALTLVRRDRPANGRRTSKPIVQPADE